MEAKTDEHTTENPECRIAVGLLALAALKTFALSSASRSDRSNEHCLVYLMCGVDAFMSKPDFIGE
jgi:hypothetical protein